MAGKVSKEPLPLPAEMSISLPQDWRICQSCGRWYDYQVEGQKSNQYNELDKCANCEN